MSLKSFYKRSRWIFVSFFGILFVLSAFGVTSQTQVHAQIVVSPTNFCLGSCPTSIPSPSGQTPSPSTAQPNPSGTSPAPSSSIAPCEENSVNVAHSRKRGKHKPREMGGISKLIQLLLDFIMKLIQLIGGGGNIPPGEQPVPDEGDNGEEQNPCPPDGEEPEPSTAQPSDAVPSGTPSSVPSPSGAAPSGTTGNNPSGEAMPGAVSGWKQIFADDFTTTVPVGAFSDCNHNTDSPQAYCGGLKNYGAYYDNWWAYPKGWADTAKSGADGNTGAPYGGVYSPEDTVFIDNGAMHVKMFRPSSGGDNHVAAVVPRKCMDTQYGRYVERFKVVRADPGFKSAHLFYGTGLEVDYPENDYNRTISAFTHPGEDNFHTQAKWTEWHTTAIERTKGQVKYYMDGKLIGTATKSIPDIKLAWVLQNESSIEGPYAQNGAIAQIDFDWVTCYAPAN